MLSIEDLVDQVWDKYMEACRAQEASFERYYRGSPTVAFCETSEGGLPLELLIQARSTARASAVQLRRAADWLWNHPLSSDRQIMMDNDIATGDIHRMLTGSKAKSYEIDGTTRYCIPDDRKSRSRGEYQIEERLLAALANAKQASAKQLAQWLCGGTVMVEKCLYVLECISRLKASVVNGEKIYRINRKYDPNKPLHAKLTEEQKRNIIISNRTHDKKAKGKAAKKNVK